MFWEGSRWSQTTHESSPVQPVAQRSPLMCHGVGTPALSAIVNGGLTAQGDVCRGAIGVSPTESRDGRDPDTPHAHCGCDRADLVPVSRPGEISGARDAWRHWERRAPTRHHDIYRDGAWVLDAASGAMRRVLADPSAEEFAWSADGHRLPITAGNPACGVSGSRPSRDALGNTPIAPRHMSPCAVSPPLTMADNAGVPTP